MYENMFSFGKQILPEYHTRDVGLSNSMVRPVTLRSCVLLLRYSPEVIWILDYIFFSVSITFILFLCSRDKAWAESQKMGAFLSVSRGSREELKFVEVEYRGGDANSPPIAIVGKGVTFDR